MAGEMKNLGSEQQSRGEGVGSRTLRSAAADSFVAEKTPLRFSKTYSLKTQLMPTLEMKSAFDEHDENGVIVAGEAVVGAVGAPVAAAGTTRELKLNDGGANTEDETKKLHAEQRMVLVLGL